ncbi:syntaxin-binding protein 1 [Strigomonas culicis]|uniref:Syntaxin-binding protein 1 n=1 Tax=Strigomonas culicis TaxID=28005 RepID=S9TPB2_9TRYP|nr:syntaxin-binding protein 1 [Strigomonas culicis]|eukprot:EPY20092.1 syntaxin-binding protein 1 [Strigomonas culicis]
MLSPIPGDFKILVCDRVGAQIVNTCMRMHDLMDHGITLVEDLYMVRQPVISSPAIYLIAPDPESVQRVIEDWAARSTYKEAHVFFTGASNEALLHAFAMAPPRVAAHIFTLKDMLMDFSVPEPLLFHMNLTGDLMKLFPPEIALSGGRENILGQVGRRLVSVFVTIGCGVPVVRYQATSRLAQQVARNFYDDIAKLSRELPDMKIGTADANTPLLIIVDRSYDAAEAVAHHRNYQALLQDLLPLREGFLYEHTFDSRGGENKTRLCPVDEQDPYWCQYRHANINVCLEAFPRLLKELVAANPNLVQGMSKDMNLNDVGSAIRALPEFQEKQGRLSMHVDILTRLMELYNTQKLATVCELEMDMAAERRPFKELFELVRQSVADASIPVPVRLRLLLRFIASSDTREFSEAKRQLLVQESGLANEASRCSNMNMFCVRTGHLKPEKAADPRSPGSPTESKGNVLTNLGRRTLRSKTYNSAASNVSMGSDQGRLVEDTADVNQAALILEAAAQGSLSMTDSRRSTPR